MTANGSKMLPNTTEEFSLTDDDIYAIEIAKNVAHRFLTNPKISSDQEKDLKKALSALDRLPEVTPGAFFEFGISYRDGTEDFSEMCYIDFSISDSVFEISQGGSVYNRGVGSDSFSSPGWLVEIGGYKCTECELYDIEGRVLEYLNLGAEISVVDESFNG